MIEIFRRGCHVAMSGAALCFSDGDLAAMAGAYRADRHPAPLVLGHPEGAAPVHGFVARLDVREGVLMAEPVSVSDELRAWVRDGRYKKISASFWGPGAPENPAPGAYYLRHVGFLGAMPPAVKGLRDPVFGERGACCAGLAVTSALEFAGTLGAASAAGFVAPDGVRVDPAGLALHRRALAFQEASGSDYATAVRRISARAVECVVPDGWRVARG